MFSAFGVIRSIVKSLLNFCFISLVFLSISDFWIYLALFELLDVSPTRFEVCNSLRRFWSWLDILTVSILFLEFSSTTVLFTEFCSQFKFIGKLSSVKVKSDYLSLFKLSSRSPSSLKLFIAAFARFLKFIIINEISLCILQNSKKPTISVLLNKFIHATVLWEIINSNFFCAGNN